MTTRGQIIINDLNKKIQELEQLCYNVKVVKIKNCSDCMFNKFTVGRFECVILSKETHEVGVISECPLKLKSILFKLDLDN